MRRLQLIAGAIDGHCDYEGVAPNHLSVTGGATIEATWNVVGSPRATGARIKGRFSCEGLGGLEIDLPFLSNEDGAIVLMKSKDLSAKQGVIFILEARGRTMAEILESLSQQDQEMLSTKELESLSPTGDLKAILNGVASEGFTLGSGDPFLAFFVPRSRLARNVLNTQLMLTLTGRGMKPNEQIMTLQELAVHGFRFLPPLTTLRKGSAQFRLTISTLERRSPVKVVFDVKYMVDNNTVEIRPR